MEPILVEGRGKRRDTRWIAPLAARAQEPCQACVPTKEEESLLRSDLRRRRPAARRTDGSTLATDRYAGCLFPLENRGGVRGNPGARRLSHPAGGVPCSTPCRKPAVKE